MIGIVGGIGPLAGVDLYKKILEHTVVHSDQDHLPVLLAALPNEIVDRSNFLLHKTAENPAIGLAKVILLLENAGAKQIAIACNTAHAPAIFEPMLQLLEAQGSKASIINLIEVTIQAIIAHHGDFQRIGILSTSGTYKTNIYQDALSSAGFIPVMLPFDRHDLLVHKSIYKIKISGDTVLEDQVLSDLNTAIQELQALGAEAVILGCTEIGMIEKLLKFGNLEVFNPNTIMAKALIMMHSPAKLNAEF